jgi:hypothetical protein
MGDFRPEPGLPANSRFARPRLAETGALMPLVLTPDDWLMLAGAAISFAVLLVVLSPAREGSSALETAPEEGA